MIADAALVVALSRKYGKRLASYALAMLCLTSGCFFASTSKEASFCSFPSFLLFVICTLYLSDNGFRKLGAQLEVEFYIQVIFSISSCLSV